MKLTSCNALIINMYFLSREYLTNAEQEGVVLDVSGDLPKSFVVCDHPYHPQIVYLSQLNTSTLKNRAESDRLVL